MGCCRKLSEAEKVALPECRANLHPENETKCRRCCRCCKDNLKYLLILVAIGLGCALGYVLIDVEQFTNAVDYPRTLLYFTFTAEIINRILTFISLPLALCSIVAGVSGLDTKISVKVGVFIGIFYFLTSVIATIEGFLWMYVLNPGANSNYQNQTSEGNDALDFYYADTLMDIVRNIFPDNFVTVFFETYHTSLSWKEIHPKGLQNETVFAESFNLTPTHKPNMLGLTVWVALFAVFLTCMGKKKVKPLAELFDAIYKITSTMYLAFLWFYPIAVILLIARHTIEMQDPFEKIRTISKFLLTVLVGEMTHFLIIMPLIYWMFTRRNPFVLLFGVSKALIMAVASSNSSLTLPVTLDCLESHTRVHPGIARYTCPIGAVFNKDGSALYQVMVVVFFAKYRGLEPSIEDLVIMGAVSLALSFGASHVRDGVIIYAVLFHFLHMPMDDLYLLYPVHWIMTRLRTMISVWSDCIGAAVVHKLAKSDLELLQYRNSQYRLLKYDVMDTTKEEEFV